MLLRFEPCACLGRRFRRLSCLLAHHAALLPASIFFGAIQDHFEQLYVHAYSSGYACYVSTIDSWDVATCAQRNVHGYDADGLAALEAFWEPTPAYMALLDCSNFTGGNREGCSTDGGSSTTEVEMGDDLSAPPASSSAVAASAHGDTTNEEDGGGGIPRPPSPPRASSSKKPMSDRWGDGGDSDSDDGSEGRAVDAEKSRGSSNSRGNSDQKGDASVRTKRKRVRWADEASPEATDAACGLTNPSNGSGERGALEGAAAEERGFEIGVVAAQRRQQQQRQRVSARPLASALAPGGEQRCVRTKGDDGGVSALFASFPSANDSVSGSSGDTENFAKQVQQEQQLYRNTVLSKGLDDDRTTSEGTVKSGGKSRWSDDESDDESD